jgi:hypothetical protein
MAPQNRYPLLLTARDRQRGGGKTQKRCPDQFFSGHGLLPATEKTPP